MCFYVDAASSKKEQSIEMLNVLGERVKTQLMIEGKKYLQCKPTAYRCLYCTD